MSDENFTFDRPPHPELPRLVSYAGLPPIECYMRTEGDYVAVMRVEPFDFYYTEYSVEPSHAVNRVLKWYFDKYVGCEHKERELYEFTNNEPRRPVYRCEQCEGLIRGDELTLLTVQ